MSIRKRFGQAFRILPRLDYEGPTRADHHRTFRTERSLPGMEVAETWDNAVATPDDDPLDRTTVAQDPAPMDGVVEREQSKTEVLTPEESLRGYDGRPTQEPSGPWYDRGRRDRTLHPKIDARTKTLAEDLDGTWSPEGMTIAGRADG